MQIHEKKHGAVIVVRPQGPIAGDDADQLKTTLLDAVGRSLGRLVLDASSIPYVDSRGLEVLLDVNEELAHGGQALKLCGLNEVVREVLELTDIASLFEHFADVNSSVRSFL